MANTVSLGFPGGVGTTGVTSAEIRTDANTRARIREIGIFIGAATASTYGIGRPAARGITPTTPKDFLSYDPSDVPVAGFLQSAIAWATGPTIPADFFRRMALPGTVGAGGIFTFEDLIIPVSSSLVIWNLAANSATSNIYVVAEV